MYVENAQTGNGKKRKEIIEKRKRYGENMEYKFR